MATPFGAIWPSIQPHRGGMTLHQTTGNAGSHAIDPGTLKPLSSFRRPFSVDGECVVNEFLFLSVQSETRFGERDVVYVTCSYVKFALCVDMALVVSLGLTWKACLGFADAERESIAALCRPEGGENVIKVCPDPGHEAHITEHERLIAGQLFYCLVHHVTFSAAKLFKDAAPSIARWLQRCVGLHV